MFMAPMMPLAVLRRVHTEEGATEFCVLQVPPVEAAEYGAAMNLHATAQFAEM